MVRTVASAVISDLIVCNNSLKWLVGLLDVCQLVSLNMSWDDPIKHDIGV